jgi:hypothetical protein
MTASTHQLVAIAQRSQDATVATVRTWTRALSTYAETFSAENPLPRLSEIQAVVDAWFDLAGHLLTEQKALAGTLVDAGREATDALSEQARTVAAVVPFTPLTEAPKRADAARNGVTV